jgi:transposase InsO family protein
MGIREALTAPRSPWQNAYAERLIGSIGRECLDHVMVFHEAGLLRILKDYFEYYGRSKKTSKCSRENAERAVCSFAMRSLVLYGRTLTL